MTQEHFPGIAPATERERIEARARQPMTAKAPQRALDFGLFGSERDQLDMVDAARATGRPAAGR